MIDYYRTLLKGQLIRQLGRMAARQSKLDLSWIHAPKTARPRRKTSGHAIFAACLWRRKGYLLDASPQAFLDLCGTVRLNEKDRARLEEYWLRGITWKPLVLPLVDYDSAVKAGKPKLSDVQVAVFLVEKGQPKLRIQAYHADHSPATTLCLNMLQGCGILPRPTPEEGPVELLKAQVTL